MPAALIGAGWVWSHHELETSKEVVAAASDPVDVPALDAPVLSLRRAPEPLADDVFDRGVAKALAPVATAVNDTSCFVVTSGGRTLVEDDSGAVGRRLAVYERGNESGELQQ